MGVIDETAHGAVAKVGTRAELTSRALRDAARRLRLAPHGGRRSGGSACHRRLDRVFRVGGFILCVVLPSTAACLYYGLIAADQYTTEVRFIVRGGLAPSSDGIAALTGLPSADIVQNTLVILDYVESRTLVEQLDAAIGLRELFARPHVDWLSRLDPDRPIEKAVKYWRTMIDAKVEMPSGIVVLTLRAFTPTDAVRIANAVLDASEKLVNTLNDRTLRDTMALSQSEQIRAAKQLAAARTALEQGRNTERSLDAHASAEALAGLIADLRSDLVRLQQDYSVQKHYFDETTPQMRDRRMKIAAAERQIDVLRSELTATGAGRRVLSASMNVLDRLDAQHQLAETIYAKATLAAEQARASSERRLVYLDAFVTPILPQSARFPLRLLDTCLVMAAGLALYGLSRALFAFTRGR